MIALHFQSMPKYQTESGNKYSLLNTDEPVEKKRKYVNRVIFAMLVIITMVSCE